jgi:hypothetical protein
MEWRRPTPRRQEYTFDYQTETKFQHETFIATQLARLAVISLKKTEVATRPVGSPFAIDDGGGERCSSFSVETVVGRRAGAAFPRSFRPQRTSSSSV